MSGSICIGIFVVRTFFDNRKKGNLEMLQKSPLKMVIWMLFQNLVTGHWEKKYDLQAAIHAYYFSNCGPLMLLECNVSKYCSLKLNFWFYNPNISTSNSEKFKEVTWYSFTRTR